MRDMPQASLEDYFDFIFQAVQDRRVTVREQEKLAEPLEYLYAILEKLIPRAIVIPKIKAGHPNTAALLVLYAAIPDMGESQP